MSRQATDGISDKQMKLRYAGVCRLCGEAIPAGADAIYERSTKTVRCITCSPSSAAVTHTSSESGVAGSSARREYERRRAKDEARLRDKWGRLGGVAVALAGERQSTKAWDRGAVGEERLGAHLDSLRSDDIAILHDRRIPGSRANIDHIAITRAGVWVIDAKRYQGKRPDLRVEGGILRPRVEKLIVGGRDRTKLVDGTLWQTQLVRDAVGDASVTGVLCFVDADWPLIGGSFTTRGVHVVWPKRLAKLLSAPGDETVDVAAMREALAAHFLAA
jgi:hypothetical protein